MWDRAKSSSHDIDIAGISNAEENGKKTEDSEWSWGYIFLLTLAEKIIENVWEPEETVFSGHDVFVVQLKNMNLKNTDPEVYS